MQIKQQIGLLLVLVIFGTLVAFFIAETLREAIITFTMVLFSVLLCIVAHRSVGIENKIQQSEKLYQAIFEGAGEGILLADLETMMFKYVNHVICEMLGYSKDEILKISVRDIHPENELDRVISEFQAQARGEKVLASNIPCLRKDGDIIYADIRGTKAIINNRPYIMGFFADVTARKRAEEQLQASEQQLRANEQQLRATNQQLRASEQQLHATNQQLQESQKKYRDLAETISDWVWEVDARGVYTYASPCIKNILGYEPEEIIGKSPFDLMPSDEAQRIAEIFRPLVAEQRPILALENINLHKDGHKVVLETSGLPFFDAEGNLKGYRGVDRDITGRKRIEDALHESELLYRSLVETTNTGYVIINNDGKVLDANPEYVRLAGRRELKEICGRSVLEWTADYEKNENAKAVEECSRKGWIRNLEIDYVDSCGNVTPVEINATVVIKNGLPIILTLCRDITKRKQAEKHLRASEQQLQAANQQLRASEQQLSATNQQLKVANEELQITHYHLEKTIRELKHADQAKNQFLASMSHELRTPINAIIGFTDFLLEDNTLNSGQKRDVERITVNTQHLLRLIDDILDLAKIEAGKIQLEKDMEDIVPLAGKVIDTFKPEADKKRIQLVNQILFPLPRVLIDRNRIMQVLDNLVSNALKYTKEEGKITLSIEQKKDTLEISVADTGIGIPPQYLDKIFERFERVPNVSLPGAGGTGLGLTICRELLNLHNGKIWVESEVNKGSKFSFSLPVCKESHSMVESS